MKRLQFQFRSPGLVLFSLMPFGLWPRQCAQKGPADWRGRTDLDAGEDVQRTHLLVNDRVVADSSAHAEIAPQERRHRCHGVTDVDRPGHGAADHHDFRRLDPPLPAERRDMGGLQQREGLRMGAPVGPPDGGAAEEHFGPGLVDDAGQRRLGEAQDVRIGAALADAEPPEFHHSARPRGEGAEVVELGGVTAANLFSPRKKQQAETADDGAGGDLLDREVPTDRIELVRPRTVGWEDLGPERMERSHVGRTGDVAHNI